MNKFTILMLRSQKLFALAELSSGKALAENADPQPNAPAQTKTRNGVAMHQHRPRCATTRREIPT